MQYLSVVPFLNKRGRMMYLVGGTVCCVTLDEAHAFARGDVAPDYIRNMPTTTTAAMPAPVTPGMFNGRGELESFPWEVAA